MASVLEKVIIGVYQNCIKNTDFLENNRKIINIPKTIFQ
jgi:hypothetical protein